MEKLILFYSSDVKSLKIKDSTVVELKFKRKYGKFTRQVVEVELPKEEVEDYINGNCKANIQTKLTW